MKSSSITTLLWSVGTALAACNGYDEFCDRKWSNVSLIGTHDSAFVGTLPTENQQETVAQQLAAGIRFLQAQTHYFLDTLSMCHTSCLELYAGTLVSYLETIKTFLDANPDEVITLLLTNGDYVDVSLFGDAFSDSGIDEYAYTPSKTLAIADWPTYQELIDDGTRLIVFLDYDADVSVVPYILPEFTNYFFETPYDVTSASDFNACAIDRPSGASATGRLYIVNHFLDEDILGIDIPDTGADSTTNAATGTGSIGAQVAVCESLYGRPPNFVLLDNFNVGDWKTAQDNLNGL